MIAVVDDEPSVRTALGRLLRSSGFASETFATAAAFLESLARRRPACVLLDVNMPGMSGPEVRARLVAAGDRLPVVFMTGNLTGEGRWAVQARGREVCLRKPVNAVELLAALAAAIASVPAEADDPASGQEVR
jgi:FixJ family two-component response regulator